MKINQGKREEISNFKSDKRIQVEIGNPVKMLKMFTKDLYSSPLQTSIQEYVNNAKDANLMVGKDTSSIVITAPSLANQSVVIRDFGPGLSEDEMINIFGKVTESNKVQSNKYNGGFGIGSKSWFAVNTSFMVVSIVDKVKYYYEISYSDQIYIDFQMKEDTDEKNGVEIHLPLAKESQIEDAKKAIKRAVKFWKDRPILKNLELNPLPKIYQDKDFTLIDFNNSSIAVTLGETQYSIKDLPSYDKIKSMWNNYSVAFHFEVGEVKFKDSQEVGPDRERFILEMDEHVLRKAKEAKKKLVNVLINYAEETKSLNKFLKIVSLHELAYEPKPVSYKGIFKVCSVHKDRNMLYVYCSISSLRGKNLSFVYDLKTSTITKKSIVIVDDLNIDSPKEHKLAFEYYVKGRKVDFSRKWCKVVKEIDSNLRKKLDRFIYIVNISNIDYPKPKSFDELKKEDNPRINLIKSAEGGSLKLSRPTQFVKLNPDAYIMSSKEAKGLKDRLLQADIDIYVVSEQYFEILSYKGFKSLTRDQFKLRVRKAQQKREQEFFKQKAERERKLLLKKKLEQEKKKKLKEELLGNKILLEKLSCYHLLQFFATRYGFGEKRLKRLQKEILELKLNNKSINRFANLKLLSVSKTHQLLKKYDMVVRVKQDKAFTRELEKFFNENPLFEHGLLTLNKTPMKELKILAKELDL